MKIFTVINIICKRRYLYGYYLGAVCLKVRAKVVLLLAFYEYFRGTLRGIYGGRRFRNESFKSAP